MKKGYLAAAALLLFLTGCSGNKSYSYHPDQSSIFISGDGTLKSALVEEIDTEAKSDELESFANAEIEVKCG